MKGLVILFSAIFLIGFVFAGITTQAIENSDPNDSGMKNNDNSIMSYGNESYSSGMSRDNESENETEKESSNIEKHNFCGTSTLGACQTNDDCTVGGCSQSVCQSKGENPAITTCIYSDCMNAQTYNAKCGCSENKCRWNKISSEEIKNLIREKNRLKFEGRTGVECPDNCTCNGVTVKCILPNGGRELTIYAGESGNIIIQVKGENMTTNVTLYKSDGKIYGVFKNNETKEVKLLPDQVREKIRERLSRQLENENVTLNEDGSYDYTGEEKAKLFSLFPVKVAVKAQLNPETGKVTKFQRAWWSFLASSEGEQIVGASCGTVTPGYNDACCQNKGYDFWNSTAVECEFNPDTSSY